MPCHYELKRARREAGPTQAELAKLADVSAGTISKLECLPMPATKKHC